MPLSPNIQLVVQEIASVISTKTEVIESTTEPSQTEVLWWDADDLSVAPQPTWQAFTPQMYVGTTPHPSWGNSTRKGRWVRELSGTVHFTAEFVFGSTYAGVPGMWSLGLPTPCNNSAYNLVVVHVTSTQVLGGTPGEGFGIGKIEATTDNTTVKRLYVHNTTGATLTLAGSDPWATGNRLLVTGTYEGAPL